jgi:putative addiction module killer protein
VCKNCQIWQKNIEISAKYGNMKESQNMAEMRTFRSSTYKQWYGGLTDKEKRIVDSRVDTARNYGVLNKYKSLDKAYSLYEFKWDSGMRVYFSLLKDKDGNFMLLLTGGNKNSQPQDITDSKNLIGKAVKSIKDKEKKEESDE